MKNKEKEFYISIYKVELAYREYIKNIDQNIYFKIISLESENAD